MGIACEQLDENRIVIHPGKPHGCKIKTFEDHRVAMAFAIPGLVTDGIVKTILKYSIPCANKNTGSGNYPEPVFFMGKPFMFYRS